ncbi:hypothetical protein HDV01_006469 [Terramyces sp. JEL0728]|nr:hypothetical protein HDV01_006469 [Terramyces sp. JEL0728]
MNDKVKAAQDFHVFFNSQKHEIAALIEKKDVAKAKLAISNLTSKITDAGLFLPSYDQQKYMAGIKELDQVVAGVSTRKKFSFKKKDTEAKAAVAVEQDKKPEIKAKQEDALPTRLNEDIVVPETVTDLVLENLDKCTVVVKHTLTSLHLKNIKNSVVNVQVEGSSMIQNIETSFIKIQSWQLRCHDSDRVLLKINCRSDPIIEDCKNMVFSQQTFAYTGDLTFYGNGGDNPFVRPAIGACAMDPNNGVTDLANAKFVAVSQSVFDSSKCGMCVQVTYNGKVVVGANVDRCPGCQGAAGLDLSPYLFLQLADSGLNQGVLRGATWDYVTCPADTAVHTISGLQGVAGAPIISAGQTVVAAQGSLVAAVPAPVPAVTIRAGPTSTIDSTPAITSTASQGPIVQDYLIINKPEGPAAQPITDSNGCGAGRFMFCVDDSHYAYCAQPKLVSVCPNCQSTPDNMAISCV